MSFDKNLEFGQAGESKIAKWLMKKGYSVLPVYEKIIDTGKGPQIFNYHGGVIAPDLLAWRTGKTMWVEAKRKSGFSWHRITGRFVTGIDKKHYEHYLRVDTETPWEVYLLFLQHGLAAKDSPPGPSGLYGDYIRRLSGKINHTHKNWGRYGMVYWAEDQLRKLADIDELAEI